MTLPERYTHLDVLASTIDFHGRLVALLIDPARFGPLASGSAQPNMRYNATAVICDATDVHEIALNDLDLRFTVIDVRGDGIVVGAASIPSVGVHARTYAGSVPAEELDLTTNVWLFDDGGTPVGTFYAGDAIEQLVTDRDGRIWIAYIDQARYWAAEPGGTRHLYAPVGLARWDDANDRPWLACENIDSVFWMDCYSLNVGHARVHACPFPRFPLVEIDTDGDFSSTANPVEYCHGLAVSGSDFAFLYPHLRRDDPAGWEIRMARRQDGVIVETGQEWLTLPDGRTPTGWVQGKVGRDATLFLQEAGDPRRWYRYDMDDAK
ncbi:hypothetical protein [Nocardia sp. NPDC051981]|uniref:hypothetical protein n=1 Tax=Nocardia sp. NPDC051981 TaxID=3155417 RepID=UPI0034489027